MNDLAVTGAGSTCGVGVLLNQGDGTFAPAVTHDAGCSSAGAVIGDVNGDGKPDILVVNRVGLA